MNPPIFQVLLIEHDADFVQYLRQMLGQTKAASFDVSETPTFSEGLRRLAELRPNVVIIDLAISDGAGLANVPLLQAVDPAIPILIVGKADDESLALEVKHAGAADYLVKTLLSPPFLSRAILYAIERHQHESQLIDAERKYHGLFDHIVEGVFQTSPEGNFLMANNALAHIYGYDSAEELTASVTDIARKLYVEENRRADFIRLMQEHDTVEDFQSRIYRKNGEIIWISENVRAVRHPAGHLLFYEGTVEDISARKLAAERLRDSEHLYHSLVENLPQNIFRKDFNGRFTFANQRFCQTVGLPLEKILGLNDAELFSPEMPAKYQADDQRVLRSGVPFETVENHPTTTGEIAFVQVIKTALRDADNQIIGTQGIFWDITARRRAEAQLQAANLELDRQRNALAEHNQELQKDLRMASEFQQNLLPDQYPTFPPDATTANSLLRFHHRYLPNQGVGGDFFTVLPISEHEAGIFLCDVMGHGVRSALLTAMISGLLEELKPAAGDPGKFLTQLNRDLCAMLKNVVKNSGTPILTTAFYLVADTRTGLLRFANAGHPKPFLLRRSAGQIAVLANKDAKNRAALGLSPRTPYTTTATTAAPDDAVLLFTDGLFEVEDPGHTLYTVEELQQAALRSLPLHGNELLDALLHEVQSFALGTGFSDDVCALTVEITGLATPAS